MQQLDVQELLPEPALRLTLAAAQEVGLAVHDRPAVAGVILARDHVPAEYALSGRHAPVVEQDLLVATVEVVAHDDPLAEVVVHKPAILFVAQPALAQILAYVG